MDSTAKGETSPGTEQPPLASGTKSNTFQSFMEDSGGEGIESPVTFGAVVNSDCPSTLVKRMAGLRTSEVQSDTSATEATVLPGELYSNETEGRMSPSKYVEGTECPSSSPRELGQVLKVPASASFDLRQAAEGDVNVDVDSDRSAIFHEMLQMISDANNSPGKSVVLSLVEKEAMELAASFVVEVDRTRVAVPRIGGANQEAPQKSLETEVFEAGGDSGGNVCSSVTTGAAQAEMGSCNRLVSFSPGSSATSRLVKPQRKSVGDVGRVPEIAPESSERFEGPDGVGGRASRNRSTFRFGTDVGATRKMSPDDARAQRMQQTMKCGKSEGPRGASEEESIGQGERRTVTRRDQVSKKGDSRRNSHNGNLRRGQSLKGLTVPEPFKLSTSNRPGSYFKTPMEREEECLAYMKKHQFKARPYRPDGFGIGGEQGVLSKHHSGKPLTKQKPFRLSTGSRPTRNVTSRDDCEVLKQFKARPMPDYVKSRRQSVNPADKPVSLAEAEPSSLRKEEAVKRARARTRSSVLDLEHFRLSSQIRHERAARKFHEKVRREEQETRLASKFTARPLPASTFSPEPYPPRTGILVTQPMEITMHTSLRAQQRARWDWENEARIEAKNRERLELEAANAAAEKKKIAELRRLSIEHGGMAFKAKPIARASKPAEEPAMRPAKNEPSHKP